MTGPPDVAVSMARGSAAASDMPFEDFVAAASSRLFTLALLVCGHHRAEAEDLLQGVLERAYRRWGRICRDGDPERYVRRMLVNASVDRWRRLRRRPELHVRAPDAGQVLAGQSVADQYRVVADRDQLLRALAILPVRRRAVIVLAYLEDLSEAQTSAVLGCSEGTVKSQASRALAKLREAVAAEPASAPSEKERR